MKKSLAYTLRTGAALAIIGAAAYTHRKLYEAETVQPLKADTYSVLPSPDINDSVKVSRLEKEVELKDIPTLGVIKNFVELNQREIPTLRKMAKTPEWYAKAPNIIEPEVLSKYKTFESFNRDYVITASYAKGVGARIKETYNLAKAANDPATRTDKIKSGAEYEVMGFFISRAEMFRGAPKREVPKDECQRAFTNAAQNLGLQEAELAEYLKFYAMMPSFRKMVAQQQKGRSQVTK